MFEADLREPDHRQPREGQRGFLTRRLVVAAFTLLLMSVMIFVWFVVVTALQGRLLIFYG